MVNLTTAPKRKTGLRVGVDSAKNRVWDFFEDGVKRIWEIDPQVVEQHLEKTTTGRETASGVFFYGFRYYQPATGRWLSRDPIGEQGGVNLYGFVGNDGVNHWDYLGKITIGFYGFNGFGRKNRYDSITGEGMSPGNRKMRSIATGMGVKMYQAQRGNRKAAREQALRDIFDHLNTNGDKVYDEKDYKKGKAEPIKIFGWSWGGISAIKLAREIKASKKFCIKDVAVVAVIEPDDSSYGGKSSVPDNVAKFYNWYQSNGDGPVEKDDHHGQRRKVDDPGSTDSFQHDYNSTGKEITTLYEGWNGGDKWIPRGQKIPINHRTIIWHVEQKLIDALK